VERAVRKTLADNMKALLGRISRKQESPQPGDLLNLLSSLLCTPHPGTLHPKR